MTLPKGLTRTAKALAMPAALLVIWESGVRIGFIDPLYLSSPTHVLKAVSKLLSSGELIQHVLVSMKRVLSGYVIAAILGISLGLILGWFRVVSDLFDSVIELLRPISAIAIIPFAIIWFGIGEASKIFLIAYGSFFPILMNAIAGVRSTDLVVLRAARTLGAGNLRILLTVVIPSAAPYIYTGLRISMAIAMIVIIAAEMVAADKGLGYFILDSSRVYRTDMMLVGIISVSLISLAIDLGMKRLRFLLFPWWREASN